MDEIHRPGNALEPEVSVVIASVGRDTLMQAVESCLNQTRPPLEVVLVFDLSEVPETFDAPAGVRVLCTGKTMGVNAARDLGIQSACGQAIALLDDDDYWYPEKLSAQVALMQEIHRQGMRAVVATGLDYIVDGEVVYSGPKRVIHPGQRVADYLFKTPSGPRRWRGVCTPPRYSSISSC